LAASLPPLVIGEKPELSFEELALRLELNLDKNDFEKTKVLRWIVDISNIRALFLEEAIDPKGTLSEKELDEAILLQVGLPEYIFDFLDRFENVSEKLKFFSGTFSTYFQEEIKKRDGFLKAYLEFERDFRLVMVAIRAKELKTDVMRELQFEDPSDTIVAQIIAQRDAASYDPPIEFADLKSAYLSCGHDVWQKYAVLAKWRFDRIEELVEKPLFSIDWILSYLVRLVIVEAMSDLDEARGKVILEAFVG
jgi:hypothetical protein